MVAAIVKFAFETKTLVEKPINKDVEDIDSTVDKIDKEKEDSDNKKDDILR